MNHYWIDLLERLVWTFVQAFIAGLTASSFTDLDALNSAAIAGIAAALSFVKSTMAFRLEKLGTAQFIPLYSGTYSHSDSGGDDGGH